MVRLYSRVVSSPWTKTCAPFGEAVGHLGEALAEGDDVVPLGAVFPLVVFVLPGFLSGDAEFEDGCAVWQVFGFDVFADKADDRKLIEAHGVFFFFLPCCAWAPKSKGGCSQTKRVLCPGGPEEFSILCLKRACERVAMKLFRWDQRKQKERRVPGAGFSPVAVPSNQA